LPLLLQIYQLFCQKTENLKLTCINPGNKILGQQFCVLNFDNYAHRDVQFIGQLKQKTRLAVAEKFPFIT